MFRCCLVAQSKQQFRFFVIPRTVACQVPLSIGFPRQEYWSGLPFLPPGDLPRAGIEPVSPVLAGGFFTTELPGKLMFGYILKKKKWWTTRQLLSRETLGAFQLYWERVCRRPSESFPFDPGSQRVSCCRENVPLLYCLRKRHLVASASELIPN